MIKIKASDWHLNQKRLPLIDSKDYEGYYDYQKKLCLQGCTVDGVYIPGYLYWHLNFWNTEVDFLDPITGKIDDKYENPLLRDNEWIIFNAIHQAEIEHKGLVIGGSRRLGKELADYEPVMKFDGTQIPIGECKVGDIVIGMDGKPTNIIGVFPQGVKPIYRMHLIDGRYIDCGLDHQWKVWKRADKKYEKILTTKELLNKKLTRFHTRSGQSYEYAIPPISPVEYSEVELPVDPYFFGLMLGDGTMTAGTPALATIDYEIIETITETLKEEYIIHRDEGELKRIGKYCKHTIVSKKKGVNNLRRLFDKKGWNKNSYNKRIPQEYLYSSVNQRMELLRGLMDSDGSINTDGGCEFSVNNELFANDVALLCRGLGIRVQQGFEDLGVITKNICGREGTFHAKKNRVYIRTDKPIFKLSRKLNRISKRKRNDAVAITKIEYLGEFPATCIMVDNEDHMFLTKDYIPTHNSVFEASYIAHGATFDQDSQNVISGLNAPDIKLITNKISKGLTRLPKAWHWMKIEENWKSEVVLGLKERNGDKYPFSSILIRNLDDGNNEEVIAGTKPKKLIIDEGGKGPFLAGLQAARPGFTTAFGWICSPIITFTGGDMDNYQDAKELFENPSALNFLEYPHETKANKTHGLFLGMKYRLEGKVETTLADYLQKPNSKELKKIPFMVSNEEKALEATIKGIEEVKKLNKPLLVIKEEMYYPKTAEEMFASTSKKFFKAEPIKRQIQRIEDDKIKGQYVELFHDGEKITWKPSKKVPVTEFPVKRESKDCPIIIYEHPVMENPTFGLYTAGVDSYIKDGDTKHSESLGTCMIFKRIYNASTDKFQNQLVASFAARPESKDEFFEQVRFLIKYYNAWTLVENDEMSFIDYMKNKSEAVKYLAPQPAWLRAVTPYSTQNQSFGLSRSSDKVRTHLHDLYRRYLNEVIHVEHYEDGSVKREILGVNRIFDAMLLTETKDYDGEINADRLVAFELALCAANDLEISMGSPASSESDPRFTSITKKRKKSRSMFGSSNKMFK